METTPIDINNIARRYIDDIQQKCTIIKPLVVINCITYNHEKFLRDALEGFVMQQTDFPFVAIVHDDASTDGTATILREYAEKYPDIILPIYEEENQYRKSLGRVMRAARNATGAKYVAMCEGDDYWTDPHKLQKQVDFLESHPDYSLVAHNCIEMWVDGSKEDKPYRDIVEGDYPSLEIYKFYPFQTASIVFHANVYDSEKYQKARNYKILSGDSWLMLSCCELGKVYCFADIMSVYRRHASGMSFYNRNQFKIESILEKRFFGKEFGLEIKKLVDTEMPELLMYELMISLRLLDFKQAFKISRYIKTYCDMSFNEIVKVFFHQLSLFKPFKYFISSKSY